MPVKEIEKNPNLQNGTLTEASQIKQSSSPKLAYIESYGCQMNFADSEVVASILTDEGYQITQSLDDASLVLVNTCSIREKAEQTIRKRLEYFNSIKKDKTEMTVGVLGCMAERLKHQFLEEEKIVDLVVGPDAYKDIPNLLEEVAQDREAVNVLLSKEETYGDIAPIRLNSNGVSAFVSITRGCDNMCTFCVVPFTRGRERSRDPKSILEEVNDLAQKGYKEITLLGQNVDSYLWYGGGLKKDFEKASNIAQATAIGFSKLLDLVATSFPTLRIRFFTSNPQDLEIEVLHVIAKHPNICRYLHLPVQSGSSSVLKRMNRQHTREEYMELTDQIKKIIPGTAISQDMIVGFCGETDEEHRDTLSMMEYVGYDYGFMYAYSERPGTLAAKRMEDDVPQSIKKQRLNEIINLQRKLSSNNTKTYLKKTIEVLIEGTSKKSQEHWMGRNSQNYVTIFPKNGEKIGDYVLVKVEECTSATLIGTKIGTAQDVPFVTNTTEKTAS